MSRRLATCLVAAVSVLACASSVMARDAEQPAGPITYTPTMLPEQPAASALLLRLTLATTGVLAIGGIAVFAVRRLAPRMPAGKSDSRLRIVETLALGQGSSLYLLECCGRRFVAGVSPSGLRSLAPLPEPFENELDVLTALT
jgi:flagellar biogenesis protein FliO